MNRPAALLAASTLWDTIGGGALVVACSGGADSVALARCAAELLADPQFMQRFAKLPRLILWHLDHGIRSNSADDARFVESLAQQLRAEAIIESIGPDRQLADTAGNLEAVARTERYTRLLALLAEQTNWRAATAHHLDDQAETVLHHLVRGSHLSGLRGIAPVYRSVIFRPWLALRRSEITEYLASRDQKYVVDQTNFDVSLTRNLLRHKVLPLLEEVNSGAAEHIARLASIARDAMELQHEDLAQLEVQVFNADELARWLPLLGWPRGYEVHRLWEGWSECGQLAMYVQGVLHGRFTLTAEEHETLGDWAANPGIPLILRGVELGLPHEQLLTLTTRPAAAEPVGFQLHPAETLSVGSLRVQVSSEPTDSWQMFRQRDRHTWEQLRSWPTALAAMCASPPDNPAWECYLHGARQPLHLRTWRVGERMELAGGGSSTVGDLFTNAKVPEPLRPLWCVLADADDRALWLPGIADGAAMRLDGEPELLVRIQVT
jgi:tRNA(Ile)-lysidine synthetase-like protein